MDSQLVSALLGFVGGVLSSAITTFTILYTRRSADKALETDEIRKRRVEIIYNLLGSRYVLTDKYQAASSEVQVFNTAMAAFSVYFTSDRAVAEAYDRFLNSKTDDNLTAMLSIAAKIAKLDLLDTHLRRVMTVPASNFSVIINPSAAPAFTYPPKA
jgi:hypothetical protein